MEGILGDLMTSAISARALSDERSYQMFITGLIMCLQGRHHITADFESGDGYRDIRMERVSGAGANVAMELEKARSEGNLAHLAEEALAQIGGRRYSEGLEGATVLYGISFFKRAPRIVSEILDRFPKTRMRNGCNREGKGPEPPSRFTGRRA